MLGKPADDLNTRLQEWLDDPPCRGGERVERGGEPEVKNGSAHAPIGGCCDIQRLLEKWGVLSREEGSSEEGLSHTVVLVDG